jgi:hypothetical protein
MSVTKGIEFKIGFDTKEANKQIQDIQKRLQEMQKSQSYADRAQAQAGGQGGPQSERAQKVFKEHRERLLAISKEELVMAQRSADAAEKAIVRAKTLVAMEGLSAEKKQKAQEILNALLDKEVLAHKKIIDLKDEQAAGTPGAPGQAGEPSGGGILSGMSRQGLMTIVGAATGVAKFIGESFRYQQEKAQTIAGINQSLYRGSGVEDIMSGRGSNFAITSEERGRARFNALEAQKGMTMRETAGGLGGATAGAVGGFFAGGPVGAVVGGLAGLAGGSAVTGGQLLGGTKSMLQGEGFSKGVERARQAEFSADQEANRLAEIAKDPLKHRANEFFDNEGKKILQIQQMSGLTSDQMMGRGPSTKMGGAIPGMPGGNYVEQGAGFQFDAGQKGLLSGGIEKYTTSQILNSMAGIAGAGGSSAQMAQAQTALDLKRNYGVQSSNELIGMLSGKMGAGQSLGTNNEVVKKMLSEAFSTGIDTSTMGIETERFLKASTSFIMESGVRTEAGMTAVAGGMSNFVSDPSLAGIQSGVSAREQFENVGGAGGPAYTKALKVAALRKEFPQLNEKQLLYLSQRTPDQIKAGEDPILQDIAEDIGGMENLQKGSLKSIEKSMTFTQSSEKRLSDLKTKQKELAEGVPLSPEELKKMKREESAMALEFNATGVGGNLNSYGLMDLVGGSAKTFAGVKSKDITAPGRELGLMDKKEIADAVADQAAIKDIKTYEAQFTENVSNIAKVTKDIETELRNLKDAIAKNRIDENKVDNERASVERHRQYLIDKGLGSYLPNGQTRPAR